VKGLANLDDDSGDVTDLPDFVLSNATERWRLAGWTGGVLPPNRQTLNIG